MKVNSRKRPVLFRGGESFLKSFLTVSSVFFVSSSSLLEPELRELESLLFPELELKLLECWMLLDQFEPGVPAVAVFSEEGVELSSGEGDLISSSLLVSVLTCSLLKVFCLDGECSLILAGLPADRVM